MLISVTNATPSNSFDIFFTPNFNPGYVWNFYAAGSVGQSNFTVPIVSLPSGFYIADLSSDFDGDGIPNWEDANPNNPNIGILTVIIDSPTNGYTFR